jgi:hypothetical protein
VKGAIASVEIYVRTPGQPPRRLSLTIASPSRDEAGGWSCRLALADLHRPRSVAGRDSVEALAGALSLARDWLGALRAEGLLLTRDRDGREPYEAF